MQSAVTTQYKALFRQMTSAVSLDRREGVNDRGGNPMFAALSFRRAEDLAKIVIATLKPVSRGDA